MNGLGWMACAAVLAGCENKAGEDAAVVREDAGVAAGARPEPATLAPASEEGPEAVARRYVELGAKGGDLEKARALVLPRCQGTDVWEVDAARLMGVRLAAKEVTARVAEVKARETRVEVTVRGFVKADKTETEAKVLGEKVKIEIGELDLASAIMTTTLTLERTGEGWRVACP